MPLTVTGYIPSIKPGAYPATLVSVEERVPKADPSNVFRVWLFEIDDGSKRTVDGTSSLATSSKSKAAKWITALIGRPPVEGETLELEGLPCTIVVGTNDDGYERVEAVTARSVAPVTTEVPGPPYTPPVGPPALPGTDPTELPF